MSGVDGRSLDEDYLAEHGIRMLPGFSEPYHGRPLTLGEIGCFMSHFNIWQVSRLQFQVQVGFSAQM
jgi:collagen beta-1,O-galactosyltransferase